MREKTVWFTADTHFGHQSLIHFAKRPFTSVIEMDAALVHGWNAVVAPGDTVWHLGDFTYQAGTSLRHYREKLNGRIHLVAGNHDSGPLKQHADLFASVSELKEIDVEGKRLVLCHYPLREWPGAWRGAWHLHGHVHGRFDGEPNGRSLDVGVDSHDFRPIGMPRIRELLADRANPFSGRG